MKLNFDLDFEGLSDEEKEQLLIWAREVRTIRNNKSLSLKQKIEKIGKLNNTNTFKNVSKFVYKKFMEIWNNANWAKRLALVGGFGTLLLVGFSGVGIAALGGAIGFPLFLLTAAGGLVLGTIIDALEKKN